MRGVRNRGGMFVRAYVHDEGESPYAFRPHQSASHRVRRKTVSSAHERKAAGLHPYLRTMFLSLAVGTAGVIASCFYYVRVSAATAPFLEMDAERTGVPVSASSTAPAGGLVEVTNDANVKTFWINEVAADPRKLFPREYLKLQAQKKGFDFELLSRIAQCESKWRMVPNTQSSAFGFFQILDGTERLTPQYKEGLRKDDPYVNIDMALALYEKYGPIPWYESQSCWAK